MPYRFWHYACKLMPVSLFICALLGAILRGAAGMWMAGAAIVVFLCLALTGGVMGLLMTLGRLTMRCPYCGRSGRAWGGKREGLRMECPQCGVIRGGGVLGLKLIREAARTESALDGGRAFGERASSRKKGA